MNNSRKIKVSLRAKSLEELLGKENVKKPRIRQAKQIQSANESELLKNEYEGFYQKPRSQAERIMWKFGGVRSFCRALKDIGINLEVSGVYKWLYPREKGGTGGHIPLKAWDHIIKAAKNCGLILTKNDLDPTAFSFPKPVRYEDQRGIYGVVERKGKYYGADVDTRSKFVIQREKELKELREQKNGKNKKGK